ncbi:hypothetical protein ACLB2K_061121 [Fragaria x ananassa]
MVPGCIIVLLVLAATVWPYLPIWCIGLYLIFFASSMALNIWSFGVVSVVKLQAGQGSDLGFDLNRIAESADTSTYKGLSYVLNERHQEYLNSSSVSVVSKFGRQASQIYIDRLSINERLSHKETLVNADKRNSYNIWQNEDIMVTLFVGAKGELDLPAIYDDHDIVNVLQKLRTIGSGNNITAVEVLWSPQIFSMFRSNKYMKVPRFLKFLYEEFTKSSLVIKIFKPARNALAEVLTECDEAAHPAWLGNKSQVEAVQSL